MIILDVHPRLSCFSRMRSEGFPFIVCGSGGWTLVRLEWLVASSSGRRRVVGSASRRRRVVNSVSMGEAAKHLLFEGFQAGCHIVLRGRRGTLYWEVLCASFVVQSSTGKDFVQAL